MIYVIKGLVKGKPMLALMTTTADKVEDYNLIDIIKDHIQSMLMMLKSPLVLWRLRD